MTDRPHYCTCPGPHRSAPESGTSPSYYAGVCDPNYGWAETWAKDEPSPACERCNDTGVMRFCPCRPEKCASNACEEAPCVWCEKGRELRRKSREVA